MVKYLKAVKHAIERWVKVKNRIGLSNRGFTILSNNCVGGYVYQYFGINYRSPTAGVLIDAEDFIKLCENPRHYLTKTPQFIPRESCKHSQIVQTMGKWGEYPIGRIDDIEIYFMHYPTEKEALEKWVRRSKRVNYSNMVYLLAENETCTSEIIEKFCNLVHPAKICLTYHKYSFKGTIYSEVTYQHEKHHWRPEEIIRIVDWKKYLNNLQKQNEV